MKTIARSGVRIFVLIAVTITVVFTALGLTLSWWAKDSQHLAGQIDALITAKLAMLHGNLNDPKTPNVFRTGMTDREVLDKFRTVVAEFEREEEALVIDRRKLMEERFHFVVAGILVAGLVALIAIWFVARHMRSNINRYENAERRGLRAQKMEAIGQLSGGIAHDFNNLLQVVSANLELALPHLETNKPALNYLQTAMLGLAKGASLTRQLLAFARRQPLRPEPTEIDALMTESLVLLERTLGEKYEIKLAVASGLWRAMVDPVLLQNALLNLALNARDAMKDGGHLTIEVANATLSAEYASRAADVVPGDYVMLAVSDTGTGMRPEVLARAFEPFFTTKEKGNGLGLAMVFGFVKQSGGHIKFTSEVGHGTTVNVFLPRTDQLSVAKISRKDRVLRGHGETILVVEDNEGVRVGVVAQLSELGYQPIAAADGKSATEALAQDSRIALLITDVVLRGAIDSHQVVDAARRARPGLPVIYMSGYTENVLDRGDQIAENTVLLSKPFTVGELGTAIAEALATHQEDRDDVSAGPAPCLDAIGQAKHAPLPHSILVVEDDEDVRSGMVTLLKRMGHSVFEAGSARDALEIIDAGHAVDILITDLGLPDSDGISLAGAMLQRRPALEVLVSTGQSTLPPEASQIPGRKAPVLLVKPYSSEELASAIGAIMASMPQRVAAPVMNLRHGPLDEQLHDLRTPLQALSLFVAMIGGKLGPDNAELLNNINACIVDLRERLSDLVAACEDCQKSR